MFHVTANGTDIYYPLSDNMRLLSPKLILEMGKAGSLEFSIPPTNSYYDRLQQLSTSIQVDMDGEELFRGRVLSNARGFDNTRKIYAEGDLAYLVDSVQKGEKYSGTTHELFRKIIAAHNSRVDAAKQFEVGEIGIEDREIFLYGQSDDVEDLETGEIDYRQIVLNSTADEWMNSFDYIESALIDYCGGYLRTRREGETTYIDLLTDYGNQASQEIEFGKNILDLTEDISAEDLFTVLIPLGDENLTIESVNGGNDELVDEEAVARYGRIVRTHVFGNVNQASTLLENGRRYLASNVNVPVTISVKAVDLHFVDSTVGVIRIGDKVHINSLPHGIYENFTCTRIEYDLANPSNNVYTFGNPKQTLTERYRKDRKKEAGGGGGGGGAAAAEAEKQADDEIKDFYKAWVDWDPETAHVSLGALYKDYEHSKLVLERECGIDLNGVAGNVNIKSLQEKYDDAEQRISSQAAQINLLQEDMEAQIGLVVTRYDQLEEIESSHRAEFLLFANNTESAIEAKADRIELESVQTELTGTKDQLASTRNTLTKECGIYLDGQADNVNIRTMYQLVQSNGDAIRQNSADIEAYSNNFEARVQAVAQSVTDNATRIAEVELRAGRLESSITLKADKTTIDSELTTIKGTLEAYKARFETIEANYLTTENLATKSVRCQSLLVTNSITANSLTAASADINTYAKIAGNLVATQKWVNDKGYALSSYLYNGYSTWLLLNTDIATKTWAYNNFKPL